MTANDFVLDWFDEQLQQQTCEVTEVGVTQQHGNQVVVAGADNQMTTFGNGDQSVLEEENARLRRELALARDEYFRLRQQLEDVSFSDWIYKWFGQVKFKAVGQSILNGWLTLSEISWDNSTNDKF